MKRQLSRAEATAVMGLTLNSWRYIRDAAEEEVHSHAARMRALEWNDRYDPDFQFGEGWAGYAHPNVSATLIAALDAADVQPGDHVLDIGAGDARLSLLSVMAYGAESAYAIEADASWVKATNAFLTRFDNFYTSAPFKKIRYASAAWQDLLPFPEDITIAFFIAWHCGPRMRAAVLEALAPTRCRALVDNFGMFDASKFTITPIAR